MMTDQIQTAKPVLTSALNVKGKIVIVPCVEETGEINRPANALEDTMIIIMPRIVPNVIQNVSLAIAWDA